MGGGGLEFKGRSEARAERQAFSTGGSRHVHTKFSPSSSVSLADEVEARVKGGGKVSPQWSDAETRDQRLF